MQEMIDVKTLAGRQSPSWLAGGRKTRVLALMAQGARVSVAELAAAAGISEAHFSRAFKREFGQSPYRYSRDTRLDNAAQELILTTKPLAMIALDHGFADQTHFSRFFTRKFGLPPLRYRKEHQPRPRSTTNGRI